MITNLRMELFQALLYSLARYKYYRDGSIALLFYNNGHTDKLGYCGRLVVWLMLGKLSQDQRSLVW